MPNGYFVEQNVHGRWLWGVVVSDSTFSANSVLVSPVTFQRESQAAADYVQHAAAALDGTGRLIRTKDELRSLVRAGMYATTVCSDAYFGQVHWHPNDACGCNWDVCRSYADGWSLQQELVRHLVDRLRDSYNLCGEDG